MKYTKLTFSYSKFETYQTDNMNGFTKNKLHTTLGDHLMFIDTDKVEIGREKFKRELLKYYNNLINNIEEQI